MANFRYRALAATGEIVSGEMEAASRNSVIDHLQMQGHWPIEAGPSDETAGRWRQPLLARRPPQRALAMLIRELATLLRAGLPLDRSLAMLTGMTRTRRFRRALEDALARVRAGAPLADALAAQRDTFSPLHIGMIRAGEAGGQLPDVLARLGALLARAQELRDTVVSALIYPIVLLVLAGVSVIVILTVMVPQFEPLFESAGAALPLSTSVLLFLAHGLRDYGWLLPLAAVIMGSVLLQQRRSPEARAWWDRAVLRIPLVGELVAKIETARFCRCLGTLLGNGVSLLAALSLSRDAIGNRTFQGAVDQVLQHSKEGRGISGPLRRTGVFSGLAVDLIQIGEESGSLPETLLRAADTFDAEVKHATDRLLALMVPAITIGLGGLVAAIVGSVLSAILSVNALAI